MKLSRWVGVAVVLVPALTACNIDDAVAAGAGQGIDLPNYGPNAVAEWHDTARQTILPPGVPDAPTASERAPVYDLDMATVTVAMYDTLALVTGNYSPLTPQLTPGLPAKPGAGAASQEYATHGAACAALGGLFPSRSSFYGARCTELGANASLRPAFDYGAAVAQKVLAWRDADGREVPLTPYGDTPHTQPGEFRSLNPNPAVNPVNYTRPFVRPFVMTSASQFRGDGPNSLASPDYAADLAETAAYGSATSTVRTEAQTQNARFHTMPPPLFWMQNLQQFATSRPTLVENARLMAALWVGQADAITGCFESKYHFLLWRPVTALRTGDPYGNLMVTDWEPVVPTPNHPEYPAAHSCGTGATVEVLEQVFGTKKVRFSFETSVASVDPAYRVQNYQSTTDMEKTIQEARIVGGMHLRTSTVHGDVLGMKVGKLLMKKLKALR